MPSKEKERVYWDSCVFIDLLQRTPGRIEVLDEYATQAERGELEIVTSDLALVEVAKLPTLGLSDEQTEQWIIDFFENPYIILRSVDRRICIKAREVARIVGMRSADAIHVATAVSVGVAVFYTYDERLRRKAPALAASGKILDKDGNLLRMVEPEERRPPMVPMWEHNDET